MTLLLLIPLASVLMLVAALFVYELGEHLAARGWFCFEDDSGKGS
jgi:hypothetical protein